MRSHSEMKVVEFMFDASYVSQAPFLAEKEEKKQQQPIQLYDFRFIDFRIAENWKRESKVN